MVFDKDIENFFENLKIGNRYYSRELKQSVLLIGEKDLYLAIKQLLETDKH